MSDKYEVEINEKWCTGCGLCVDICPQDVFELDVEKNVARAVSPGACVGCLMCEERCPDFAIQINEREEDEEED